MHALSASLRTKHVLCIGLDIWVQETKFKRFCVFLGVSIELKFGTLSA